MKQQGPYSLATVLSCSHCNRSYPLSEVINVSPCCNQPLLVEYDLQKTFAKEELAGRENDLWRYFEILPVKDPTNIISLGEGFTPILPLKKLSDKYASRQHANCQLQILSMGMSDDYTIALEEGSNLVRIGSLIFGQRN